MRNDLSRNKSLEYFYLTKGSLTPQEYIRYLAYKKRVAQLEHRKVCDAVVMNVGRASYFGWMVELATASLYHAQRMRELCQKEKT